MEIQLISSAECQAEQPQATQNVPEPAPQVLEMYVESPTQNDDKRINTSTAMEKITTGLKVKLDTTKKKRETQQTNNDRQEQCAFLSPENHWLGKWFKRKLLPMM